MSILRSVCLLLMVMIVPCITASAQPWTVVGSAGFSSPQCSWGYVSNIAMGSGDTPYIAYCDYTSNDKLTVMRYNGSTWENVGLAHFSDSSAHWPSLAISPGGTPYVAFLDKAHGERTTVMKFDGSSWVVVDGAGFSAGVGGMQSLAISSSGALYVAYFDAGYFAKATVMKNEGSGWVLVGSPGFTAGQATYISLKLAGSVPYIAYKDEGNGNKATVMRYTGGSWETVGSAGFSAGQVYLTCLAITAGGVPYVGYLDVVNGGKSTVMRYNGTQWETVGSAGFSSALLSGLGMDIAISESGTPYVAYTPEPDFKATVLKYNGSSWVAEGDASISTGGASAISMAFNADGTPYVAFTDGDNGLKMTVMKSGVLAGIKGRENGQSTPIELFPNPSKGSFTLRIADVDNEDIGITMMNSMGEKVRQFNITGNKETNVDYALPKGIYFLIAATKNGSRGKTIVIE